MIDQEVGFLKMIYGDWAFHLLDQNQRDRNELVSTVRSSCFAVLGKIEMLQSVEIGQLDQKIA